MNHSKMEKQAKTKQIVIRFDPHSYGMVSEFARTEHRTLGEFIRHITLQYIENYEKAQEALDKKGGKHP